VSSALWERNARQRRCVVRGRREWGGGHDHAIGEETCATERYVYIFLSIL